jgi:hypothetical protein
MKKLILCISILVLSLSVLKAQAPVNDDPCGAIEIPVLVSDPVSTDCVPTTVYSYTNATNTLGLPNPTCGFTSAPQNIRDVWFKCTVPASGRLVINTANIPSSFPDFVMSVYSAVTCSGSFTQLQCNDDTYNAMPYLKLIGLTPGTVIFIRIFCYPSTVQPTASLKICVTDFYTFPVDNTTKVGVGITTPFAKLDVAGTGIFRDTLYAGKRFEARGDINVTGKIITPAFQLTTNAALGKMLTSDVFGNAGWVLPATVSPWTIVSNDIYNNNAGNIGIGINTPTSKLDVNGQVTIDQKNFGGYGGLLIKGNAPGSNYPNIAYSIKNNAATPLDIISAAITGIINNNIAGAESMDLSFATSTSGQAGLSERLLIKDNGNIGIGFSNPQNPLSFPASLTKKISLYPGPTGDVGMSVAGGDYRLYTDYSGGKISFGFDDFTNGFTSRAYVPANGTNALVVQGNLLVNSTTYLSDARFKKKVAPLHQSLEKILKLKGVQYEMMAEEFPDRNFISGNQIGLIAQEVEAIVPEVVSTATDGYKSVDYAKLVPLLIEGMKQQQIEIEQLKTEVNRLKRKK